MKTKRAFLITLVLFSAFAANAQDLIVKQDGETIKAYRTDVGNNAVYYRLEDNDKAPILTINKSDVLIVKLQDGTKINMDDTPTKATTEDTEYIPKFPAEPVADPDQIAKAEIGSLIEFYDGSKGIVFYLDGNGHGLTVYLKSDYFLWQRAIHWYECVDISDIPNERRVEMQLGLGAFYCDAAIKQLGLQELPAIKWCRSIGHDWYLPSLGELYQLLIVANKSKGAAGPISKALKEAGGNGFYNTHLYFSCSEEDDTDVSSIIPISGVSVAKKYDRNYIRAIRMF